MKKVISIILGIVIFAIPCLSFADYYYEDLPNPSYLTPVPLKVFENVDGSEVRFFSNNSDEPTYIVLYGSDDNDTYFRYIVFSQSQNNNVVLSNDGVENTLSLNSYHNGYYFRSGSFPKNSFTVFLNVYNIDSSTNPNTVIDNINSSFFSVTFSLSHITNKAISWLSAVVDGVLQAPLLLFLILSSFIGIAVGLLFRFKRG